MESSTSRFGLHRPRGLRGAIVIGLALALVGAAVGTATGAVTPFQQVVVVNTAPIPVSGTVNVGSGPANQNVTVTNLAANPVQVAGEVSVSNLPVTQAVSGSVSVSNLPAAQTVSKVYTDLRGAFDAGSTAVFDFNRTINVSTLIMSNGSGDDVSFYLQTASGPLILVYSDDGSSTQNFTLPVPATSAKVHCGNAVFSCTIWVTALGS